MTQATDAIEALKSIQLHPLYYGDEMEIIQQGITALEESESFEKACDGLTEAMQRWGWQHCADEKDIISEIDGLLEERARMVAGFEKLGELINRAWVREIIEKILNGWDYRENAKNQG